MNLNFVRYMIAAAVAIFMVVFVILPVYVVIASGLDWSLFAEAFRNPVYREGVFNSALIAVITTLMVFVIALPLALLYDRFDFPLKKYCAFMMMIPMILPPFVGALGFQQIFGYYGVLNSILAKFNLPPVDFLGGEFGLFAVCLIEALHLYPILYLNLIAVLGNVDPVLDEAAQNLGAGRWKRFCRVTFPLMRPGILAGGSIVMIWSFTELGTPLMFSFNRVTPVQVFNGITELESNPLPFALVLIMLGISVLLYVGSRFFLRSRGAVLARGSVGAHCRNLEGWKKILPSLGFLTVMFLSIMPHAALLLTAFSSHWYGTILPHKFTMLHFENALSNPIVLPSVVNSLKYSTLAVIFAVLVGCLVAFAVERWKLRGAALLDMGAMLPLAIPGIVMALGYLGLSSRYDWAREIFNPVTNPLYILSAAYAVRRLPYVVRSVTAALEQTPVELEDAAANLGASAFRRLRSILLPLIAGNMIVGGLFAFSFSMLEVSDSLILAQKEQFYPITKAIYELSQVLGSGPYIACAFGIWAMIFLGVTIWGASYIIGNKISSMFRF